MTTVERHDKIVDLSMHHMVGRPGNIEEFVEHHQIATTIGTVTLSVA